MKEALLSTQYWLTIKQEVRNKLVDTFSIPRSSGSSVENTSGTFKVTSDGYTSNDLSAINVESLQKELGTDETDFYKMLKKLINKLDDEKQNKGADSSGDETNNGDKTSATVLKRKVLPVSKR